MVFLKKTFYDNGLYLPQTQPLCMYNIYYYTKLFIFAFTKLFGKL